MSMGNGGPVSPYGIGDVAAVEPSGKMPDKACGTFSGVRCPTYREGKEQLL